MMNTTLKRVFATNKKILAHEIIIVIILILKYKYEIWISSYIFMYHTIMQHARAV